MHGAVPGLLHSVTTRRQEGRNQDLPQSADMPPPVRMHQGKARSPHSAVSLPLAWIYLVPVSLPLHMRG